MHFESKNLKKFMLDDIKGVPDARSRSEVVQETRIGHRQRHLPTFTGLESGKTYGYSVRTDYLNFFGMTRKGAESAVMQVSATSGIGVRAGISDSRIACSIRNLHRPRRTPHHQALRAV